MKKIYTSYYAKVPHLPFGYVPISISRSKSPYVKVESSIPELAPALRYDDNPNRYLEHYWKQLAVLDVHRIADRVNDMVHPGIPVLLCHEKPERFCHRHLVAEWFRAHGYDCTELAFSEEHAARYADHILTTLLQTN